MAEEQIKTEKRSDKLELRRLRIVEAAVSLFIDKGFHQTGMRDIAARAKISLGNLYNHFKGKEGIIAAIGELELSDLEPHVVPLEEAEAPDPDLLLMFAAGYFDLYTQPSYAALSAEITAELFRNPQILDAFLPTRQRLCAAVERHLPDDLMNRAVTAEIIIGLIESAAIGVVGEPRRKQNMALKVTLEVLERVLQPAQKS